MEWLQENWFWVVVFVAFFAMHLFGHCGREDHGGHGGGDGQHRPSGKEEAGTDRPQGRHP